MAVSVLVGGGAAGAAAVTRPARTARKIMVYLTPGGTGLGGRILITGGIADYGTTLVVNEHGKKDANGAYGKFILKKGTFLLDDTAFDNALARSHPRVSRTTCSLSQTVSGTSKVVRGTGAYAGIHGSVRLTLVFAAIVFRYAGGQNKGQCNFSSTARIVISYDTATGAGTVTL